MSTRLHAGRLRTRVLECGCRAQPEVGGETEGRRPSFRRGASRKASSAREARVGFVRAPFKRQPSDARAHCTGTHRDDGGSVNVRGIRDATQTRIRVLFGTRALKPSIASTRRRVRPGVTAKTHRAFKFSSGTARQPRTNCDASAPDLTATGAEARSDRISHVSRHLSHPFRRAVRRRRRGNEPVRRRVRRWARRASDATASETGQPNAVAGGIADGRRRQTPLELERVARGVRGRPRWGERAAVFRVWKATRSGKTGRARWAIGAVDV